MTWNGWDKPWSTNTLQLYRSGDGRWAWFFEDYNSRDYVQRVKVFFSAYTAEQFGHTYLGVQSHGLSQAILDLQTADETNQVALFGDMRGEYICTAKLEEV